MRTFKLITYCSFTDRFSAEDEKGEIIYLDITTDGSFEGLSDSDEYNNCKSKEDFSLLMKKYEGKTIECEDISPYTPLYFVNKGRIKTT